MCGWLRVARESNQAKRITVLAEQQRSATGFHCWSRCQGRHKAITQRENRRNKGANLVDGCGATDPSMLLAAQVSPSPSLLLHPLGLPSLLPGSRWRQDALTRREGIVPAASAKFRVHIDRGAGRQTSHRGYYCLGHSGHVETCPWLCGFARLTREKMRRMKHAPQE